jgi:hypothetical protein
VPRQSRGSARRMTMELGLTETQRAPTDYPRTQANRGALVSFANSSTPRRVHMTGDISDGNGLQHSSLS